MNEYAYVQSHLERIIEELYELEDYCIDIELTGAVHKIQEALGPLNSAENAAIQASNKEV